MGVKKVSIHGQEMISVAFDRDKYSIHQKMIDWTRDNISKNYGWRYPDKERWGDDWGVDTTFGYTTFYFLKEEHASFFILKWR